MDIITTHVNADFDAFASMVAAKKLYPNARIIFPGTQEETLKDFIALIKDTIQMESDKDFIVDDDITRLIIVETRLKERLGKVAVLLDQKNLIIHIYDHHPQKDTNIRAHKDVYEKYGATVTILLKEIKKKKIKISPIEATVMAIGIYEDTGCLTFPSTTKEDVNMISYLLCCGADLGVVREYLSRHFSSKDIAVLSDLIKASTSVTIKGVNVLISSIFMEQFNLEFGSIVHRLLEIENNDVGFVLVEIPKKKVQVIARSKLPYVDVASILKKLGKGGGHKFAASSLIRNKTRDELKKSLLEYLSQQIKIKVFAKDIMHEPVKTVLPSTKVLKVKDIMDHYCIDGMCVMKKDILLGVITRNDIEKAIHHGFGHSRVTGYMSIHPVIISSNAPLYELEKLVKDHSVGFYPVVKKNKVVGVIRAYDVLVTKHKGLASNMQKKEDEVVVTNYKKILKDNLSNKINRLLSQIGRIADIHKVKCFIVGGFVRDILMGRENLDVDIVVESKGVVLAKEFAKKNNAKIIIHKKFETAKVFLSDGQHVDFATARTEFYEKPAALPIVKMSSLKQDLYRRDFTVNAMAISLNKKTFGDLFDFFNGIKDLRGKKIKVLHNLSFIDDPTRILRAVRFEQRLGFRIERHTQHLINNAFHLDVMGRLEKQRLRDELFDTLQEHNPIQIIMRMHQLHELRFIHKNIKLTKRMITMMKSIEKVCTWYFFSSFRKRKIDTWLLYLMVLFQNLPIREVEKICKEFVFRKGETKRLLEAKQQMRPIVKKLVERRNMVPSTIYKLLEPLSYETILYVLASSKSSLVRARIENFFIHCNGKRISITGDVLKNTGLPPGPYYAKVLEKTLYAKLDNIIHTKKDEIEYAQKLSKKLLKNKKNK